MATARMGPRGLGRYANSLLFMVRWRQRVAPPFCFSGGIYFRRSAVANGGGNSSNPRVDAHRRQRRRRNRDAARNSCASRRAT